MLEKVGPAAEKYEPVEDHFLELTAG